MLNIELLSPLVTAPFYYLNRGIEGRAASLLLILVNL